MKHVLLKHRWAVFFFFVLLLALQPACTQDNSSADGDGVGFNGNHAKVEFNYKTGRVRCGYQANSTTNYTLSCFGVAIQSNGDEVAATYIATGLTIKWQALVVIQGPAVASSSCTVASNGLSQTCNVTTVDTQSVTLQVALQMTQTQSQGATLTKTESDNVSLPYSVAVFGATPMTLSLSLFNPMTGNTQQGVTSGPASPIALGLQSPLITPSQFVLSDPASVCTMNNQVYFTAGNFVYRIDQNQNLTLYAGSTNPSNDTNFSHRLRVYVGPVLQGYWGYAPAATQTTNYIACYNGSVYLADFPHNRILKIPDSGPVQLIAGMYNANYSGGYSPDGIPATAALISEPSSLAFGPDGSLYFSDWNYARIRKIDSSGIITTVAGKASPNIGNNHSIYSPDNVPATSVEIDPGPLTVGPDNSIYYLESDISPQGSIKLRKVSPSGILTTVAGMLSSTEPPLGDGGPASSASLWYPTGLYSAADGSLYVTDRGSLIRKINPNGIIHTIAGSQTASQGAAGNYGDGGPATAAQLNTPQGIALDASGNIYLADSGSGRIRVITAQGIITSVAGNASGAYAQDGTPGTSAIFDLNGGGFAVTSDGSVYFSSQNSPIQKIDPNGVYSKISGSPPPGFLAGPLTAVGPDGTIYAADYDASSTSLAYDTVSVVHPDNSRTLIVGPANPTGSMSLANMGGLATATQIREIGGITVSSDNILYISEEAQGLILRVDLNLPPTERIIQEILTTDTLENNKLTKPGALTVVNGSIYVVENNSQVRVLIPPKHVYSTGAGYQYYVPTIVFGGSTNADCGGGIIAGDGSTNAQLSSQLLASLAQMCVGRIVALATSNSCSNGEPNFTLAFGQTFGTGMGYSNIVRVVRPCPTTEFTPPLTTFVGAPGANLGDVMVTVNFPLNPTNYGSVVIHRYDTNDPMGSCSGGTILATLTDFTDTVLTDRTGTAKNYFYEACVYDPNGNLISTSQAIDVQSNGPYQVVFVTFEQFTGNLNGLSGADQNCQGNATSGGITGTFKAILSDGITSAMNHVSVTSPVYNIDGQLVASTPSAFWNGQFSASLGFEPAGRTVFANDLTPWTGSPGQNCNGFTDGTSSSDSGEVGLGNGSSPTWLAGGTAPCTQQNPLYCISQ